MSRAPVRPRQSLGQNFLLDPNIARKFVRALNLTPEDIVVEIGPGTGALTKMLLPNAREVVAVEIDGRLIEPLKTTFPNEPRLSIVHHDFLTFDLDSLAREKGTRLRLVGNIPFHITSPILFKLFDSRRAVADFTATVQKEVAERITASPKTKAYGLLSVFCRAYGDPRILFPVSRHVFTPQPDVDAAVISISFQENLPNGLRTEQFFRKIVKTAFGKRRKMLRNSLADFDPAIREMSTLDFDLSRRPEELTVDEFIRLTQLLDPSENRATAASGREIETVSATEVRPDS